MDLQRWKLSNWCLNSLVPIMEIILQIPGKIYIFQLTHTWRHSQKIYVQVYITLGKYPSRTILFISVFWFIIMAWYKSMGVRTAFSSFWAPACIASLPRHSKESTVLLSRGGKQRNKNKALLYIQVNFFKSFLIGFPEEILLNLHL